MNDKLWEEYQKHLDLNIGELNIKYELTKEHVNVNDLNRTWALINHALIKAAYKKIPSEIKKKTNKSNRPKLLLNTLSLAKYLIRVVLKINKILKGKSELEIIDWIKIKEKIIKIKEKHNLEFDEEELGNPTNTTDLRTIKTKLLELNKILRTKYKIEESIYIEQQIKECSDKRCEYIVEKQSKMIDSLLEREKKSITLDRCIVKDSNNEEILLMEKDEVLKAVKDHFMRISNTDNTPNANLKRK
jgi:hypothetical protein